MGCVNTSHNKYMGHVVLFSVTIMSVVNMLKGGHKAVLRPSVSLVDFARNRVA